MAFIVQLSGIESPRDIQKAHDSRSEAITLYLPCNTRDSLKSLAITILIGQGSLRNERFRHVSRSQVEYGQQRPWVTVEHTRA